MTVPISEGSITANRMIHTIIHIGAGEAQDLERQLAGKPKRLILVEPNPDIAARLREKTRALSHVEVHEIAVIASAKDEQLATLHEYNWNSASSLREVAQLTQLFPGLRLVRNHPVKALSPATLIERLALDKKSEHALIIEAPAAERGIVDALCDSGLIGLFSKLTLTCPSTGLYADVTAITDLLTRLADFGFEPIEQDESDPDWPVFGLKRNRWRYDLQQTEKRLKTLEVRLTDLLEEKLVLEEALTERGKELDEKAKLIAEQATQLEQMVQARDAQAKLATERQAELEQVKTANATQHSRATELESELAQITKAHDEQTRLVAERQNRVSELESELADLEHRQTLIAEEMHRAEGQIDLIADVLLRETGL